MNYLTAQGLSKSYGEKVLFENLEILINKGDKIALIARNGVGKTTLLAILAGEDNSDQAHQARVIYHNDIKVGFLRQEPIMADDLTVMEYIYDSAHRGIATHKKMSAAQAIGDEKVMEECTLLLDELMAWDLPAKIEETLARFHITYTDQKLGTLSGGQRRRVALARMIIEEPELLILDEPTNHLDVDAIEWLENFLQQPSHTLLLVSHDRYFLENVCDQILELDQGKLWRYPGNYSQYLEQKTARIENEEIARDKTNKLLSKELEWIRRSPKARTTKNKARIDNFHTLKEQARKVYTEGVVDFIIQTKYLGSKILELHRAGVTFGDKEVIKPFSYKFKKKERVGLVGPNGSGKSTFVNMITEQLKPTHGKVVVGETITYGIYDQQGLHPDADKTVIDIVRDVAEYIPLEGGKKLYAEQLLDRFMFPRSQHRVFYSKLSGGQKRRLYLLTILMKNPNFLILDEPTNDLDLMTLNALEEYLMHYPGCLILITHDRYMTDKLVDHLFIFDGQGNIKDFNGNYAEYLDYRKKPSAKATAEVVTSEETPGKSNAEIYELKKVVKRIEKQLDTLEKEKESLQNSFLDPNLSVDQMKENQLKLDAVLSNISAKEEEWMEASEGLE